MPSSAADIQNSLKTTIEAAAAVSGTFALPLSVVVADSLTSPPQKSTDGMLVQIAYIGATELARSSTKVLEQNLIGVNLSYRTGSADQSRFATCNLIAQQIRDLLVGFTASNTRVEQVLMPNPFDAQNAMQTTFEHQLTLDLDVVRSIATNAPPTVTDTGDETPIMSKTRQAVWDAIDNWPAFSDPSTWVRKFKTDDDLEELSLHDAGLADLPGIAVSWGPVDPKWWVNVMQQWHQQLVVTFWLPANWRAVAEWRLIQLMQAFYQSASVDRPNVSYIRAATGRPPEKTSPINLQLVALGRAQKLHAWQGQIALTLPINFDPND